MASYRSSSAVAAAASFFLWIVSSGCVNGFVVFSTHSTGTASLPSRRTWLFATPAEVDDLFANTQPDQARALLKESSEYQTNAELYWRYVKSFYESYAAQVNDADGDKEQQEKLLREGIEAAEWGLQGEFSNNGYLLKWKAVLMGKLGNFQPTKEKMSNSFIIKENLEAAMSLLPEDGSIRQALGEWCFKVAGISFVERQVASVLFGKPPKSSYEEALDFFQQAFEIKQNPERAIKVAETYEKLKNQDAAKEWRAKAAAMS